MREHIHLGKWTEEKLTGLIKEASTRDETGRRIDFLSKHFLNTKYKESTLTGNLSTPEIFVINLEGVDCFTLIEYIEAMRRSESFREFRTNLRKVRYRSGTVSFEKRNHFFTDWKAFNSDMIIDVTKDIGAGTSKDVSKKLNEKYDGTLFLPGVACRLREVTYIQSVHVNDTVIQNLKTGDYAGIYSKEEGLDVSHVGIIIKEKGGGKLRHASSLKRHRKVIDEDLKEYLESRPGIIVLRPRD